MTLAFVVAVSIFLGLLLFLVKEVRRPPGPMEWGRTPRWGKRLRIAFAAIVVLLGACIFWAFLIGPNRLVLHEQTIHIDNWPKELSGLRIAVLGDIHVDRWTVDDKKLRTIVQRTNQLQPDLIVILGDYMSGNGWVKRRVEPEVFAPVLKNLNAPFGVYSVLGNHDYWHDGSQVRRALEQNGIKVLEDEVLQVNARGTSMWVVGLADLWTHSLQTTPQHMAETIASVPPGAPIVAITHNPDIFPNVPQRVQLLLAAHTHGGQVRFPLIGSVVQASDFGERYLKGHVFENNHHLFVTTGIGTSIMPVRFGIPPEIVLLTLKSP
jgi:predicted MPP superfamily phosphohydrolase